jgi:AhpD family alkylhydroperoxidase
MEMAAIGPEDRLTVRRAKNAELSRGPLDELIDFIAAASQNGIEKPIRDLVAVRAAQMCGYASCLDMHIRQARAHGEHELRLHHLVVWRDSALFGPRERAALAWAEILTERPGEAVPQEIYESVRAQFSDSEISDLSLVVMAVNCWNRLHAGLRSISSSANPVFLLDPVQR